MEMRVISSKVTTNDYAVMHLTQYFIVSLDGKYCA
jgi:hypothetical protein